MAGCMLMFVCLLSICHASFVVPNGCPSSTFKCDTTDDCINAELLCDDAADCPDGSDEEMCDYDTECPSPNFVCELSGDCIPLQDQCDGTADCLDGSDEWDCRVDLEVCTRDQFECEFGGCIPSGFVCDGDADCEGDSDERDCELVSTGCVDCWGGGQCIPFHSWCDGQEDCPGGPDEKTCPLDCNPNRFNCKESGICVPWSRVCDTVNDCGDNSDETCGVVGSPVTSCRIFTGEWECQSGMCILDSKRCDGVGDCDDNSDEVRCECTSAEFRCEGSRRCVEPAKVCDGVDDCGDASDELICKTCAEKGLWQCRRDQCINHTSVCDGDRDCSTGTDEQNCPPPCNSFQFECDGTCIPTYQVCDKLEDCSNGQDEENCAVGGCAADQYPCPDGTCLLEQQLCNKRQDCSGGEDEEDCGDPAPPGFPLGLTSRYIPDVCISASSVYKPEFAASNSRLARRDDPDSCWVPSSSEDQWLQVYFGKTTNVTGVVISGGGAKWDLGSWVTSFTLAFSMDGASWTPYLNSSNNNVHVFQGNRDRHNKVSRPLEHPVTSRYIRLYPTGYVGWVAVAMEVFVTNDEDTWLKLDEYYSLIVEPDPGTPRYSSLVSDYAITASSRDDRTAFSPHQARLNNGRGRQQGTCWSPAPGMGTDQWLQIDLEALYKVAAVITQGAYNLDYWVTSYMLAFSLDGETWTPYTNSDGDEKVFPGNTDNHRYVRNVLNPETQVFAVYTRIYPLTFHKQIALRADVIVKQGCERSEAFCGGRCRPWLALCLLFEGCVPRKYHYEDKPVCEDILQAECRGETTGTLDVLGCSEIDSQFNQCELGGFIDLRRKREAEMFHYTQACDGKIDCSTGKDEEDCEDMECAMECPTEFGAPCIPERWICDDTVDCLDGKDEEGCQAPKLCFFYCWTVFVEICVPADQLGDGETSCFEGEDEDPRQIEMALEKLYGSCSYNCTSVYGRASCIPEGFVCDGDVDCVGEEDEQHCGGDEEEVVGDDCYTYRCGFPGAPDQHCVSNHLICDGFSDCVSGEDELGCGNEEDRFIQISITPTIGQQPPDEGAVDQPTTGGPTVNQEPMGGSTNGQELTAEPTNGQEPTAEPTNGQELTTEPTNDQGSFEEEPGTNEESHAVNVRAKIWVTFSALGLQWIFYCLTTF